MRPPVLVTCSVDAIHAHLLQAHEHSCRLGQPLLTAAGVSRLRELLVAAAAFAVSQKGSAPDKVVGLDSNQLVPR